MLFSIKKDLKIKLGNENDWVIIPRLSRPDNISLNVAGHG